MRAHLRYRRFHPPFVRTSLLKPSLAFLALLLALPASAAQLTIELDHASRTWQTAELLKLPEAQTVQIVDDVSYKRNMTYRAVPLAALQAVEPITHRPMAPSDSPLAMAARERHSIALPSTHRLTP